MPNKSFVEDMMTIGSGVLNNLSEARHELRSQARQKAGEVAKGLDLVTREEFEAAFAMLSKARQTQEDLAKRLARIEAHLKLSSAKTKVKTKKPNLPSVKTSKKRRVRK